MRVCDRSLKPHNLSLLSDLLISMGIHSKVGLGIAAMTLDRWDRVMCNDPVFVPRLCVTINITTIRAGHSCRCRRFVGSTKLTCITASIAWHLTKILFICTALPNGHFYPSTCFIERIFHSYLTKAENG